MKKLIICFALLTLASCGGGIVDPNTIEVSTKPHKLSSNEINFAKNIIAEQSREPEAVRFRNLYGFSTNTGDTIVCGEVNAKNAYGGYVGYRTMWVRFEGNTVKSAVWEEEYQAYAESMCSQAKLGKAMVSS